jgi:hypothetical protein
MGVFALRGYFLLCLPEAEGISLENMAQIPNQRYGVRIGFERVY